MPRKPPSWDQPTLFPFNPDDSPKPPKPLNSSTNGDNDAVQDHSPRTSEGTDAVARAAAADTQARADAGNLRQGTQGQPRKLDGDAFPGETGQRPEPDRERSPGTGNQGSGGSFALRVSSARSGTAFTRRSNGFYPQSHVDKVRASRGQPSLFDPPPKQPASDPRPPPEPPAAERNTAPATHEATRPTGGIASGEKTKARDIIAAIRTLKAVEQEQRLATAEEKQTLARFSGFGPVALSIFPDPVAGKYKDPGWQAIGDELKSLLTAAEYDSAKRTTFNAFYTSPSVITAIHEAIARLGVPANATILEPGCGTGNFMSHAQPGAWFIGVEMDSISGRIARALHPGQDIRIENFRDTRLPENRIDAVVGNVPFADLKLEYRGQKLSLHDYFFAKSVDALKPGGVMALVTTHYTLDKQNAAIRERLGGAADFLGAIRLPSDAFKREGTAVVTDIVFLRRRASGQPPNHIDPEWLGVAPLSIEGVDVPVNRYFLNHPEMVLGSWTRKDTLYGGEGYSVTGSGDFAAKLKEAIGRLPRFETGQAAPLQEEPVAVFTPPPPERHISEGSFFVCDDRTI
jgi:hypothetical protein